MHPFNFLVAIASLVVFVCSFGASPVTALATDHHHIRDIAAHAHGDIARRKRTPSNNTRHCKQRPSSSTSPTATHQSSPKPASPKPSPKPSPTSSSSYKSSAKPSPTPSNSGSGGRGKVGLAWANGPSMSVKPFLTNKVGYIYTWGPEIYPNAKALGLRSIPMLWGDNQISQFTKLVTKGYADAVMAFNEPNEPGQSNMSPSHGAQLWKQYIEPLRYSGYTMLVSPATSSNPNGMTWVKDWKNICNGGCNPTHIGVHYYDVTASGFISYMELWHNTFGLPVMPTEFACQNFNGGAQCSKSEVDSFMTDSINFMESTSWITAYFAFGVMENMQGVNTLNQLMNSAGQPTTLGYQYINQ